MTSQDETDSDATASKRFDVELFIIHPTLDPKEIDAELGLDAEIAHGVGDQRKTPKGGCYQASIKTRGGDTAVAMRHRINGLPTRSLN